MSAGPHPLDRLTRGPVALPAAFAWGLAEATLFFIVPDVLLTLIGCRSIRASWRATVAAVGGALLGGILMYAAGWAWPEASRSGLARIPGIRPALLERVTAQVSERGLGAVLLGPTEGIPYKIYAVEWGARRGDWLLFLLVSIPARGIRFLLSALLAAAVGWLIAPWTQRRARTEFILLSLFWIGFYTLYFARFGW